MNDIAHCPGAWLHRIRRSQPMQAATRSVTIGEIAKGSRNATLFGIACSHRGNGADEEALQQILLRENANRCVPPLPDEEIRRIASSAMRYDPNPTLTDLYVARRVVADHGDNIRYDHGRKRFYVWTGSHWREDRDGAVMRLVKGVTDAMSSETASIQDGKARANARKAIARLQSKPRLEGARSLIESEPGMPIAASDFDGATMLLNAPNCVIDLTTSEPREHRREDYMTRICGAVYDPNAKCPSFILFLKLIASTMRLASCSI